MILKQLLNNYFYASSIIYHELPVLWCANDSSTKNFLDLIYSVCMSPAINKSGRITDRSIVRTNGYCFTTGLNNTIEVEICLSNDSAQAITNLVD